MPGDTAFIDQWVTDARLLGTYGQQTGSFDPAALLQAASKVESLPNKTLSAPEVDDLKKLVADAQEKLPKIGSSSIWLDLKMGWMPFSNQGKIKKHAFLLIIISVLLVVIIGQLTLVYNQGTVLLSDLRVLRATEPERRAGQLSRQLIAAMKEITQARALPSETTPVITDAANVTGEEESAKPVAPGDTTTDAGDQNKAENKLRNGESSLPLQAYFQIYDDARTLNGQINFLKKRVDNFTDKAWTPVWGSWVFLYGYYSLQQNLGIAGTEGQDFLRRAYANNAENPCFRQKYDPNCVLTEPETTKIAPNVTGSTGAADETNDRTPQTSGANTNEAVSTTNPSENKSEKRLRAGVKEETSYPQGSVCDDRFITSDAGRRAKMLKESLNWTGFAEVAQEYALGTAYLTCFDDINAVALSARPIDIMEGQVSQALSPYAFWLLPALYGALGALLFHLRIILDPRLPDPEGIRIFHRIALGMLAGMILAWFWVPDTTIGGQLAGIGFGLFTLAFVFGFSLDVFFSLLERLVKLSTIAIEKVGAG